MTNRVVANMILLRFSHWVIIIAMD
jgi:hypothetical protein